MSPPHADPPTAIADASTRWARQIVGAPRDFAPLITTVEPRDEVIHRVVADVVRRDLREERIPANERTTSPPRIDLATVDPFAFSLETLRAATQHVAPCSTCTGSGLGRCPECRGDGRATCRNCGGRGKELKQYKKSSRWVNCKVCKASGLVPCGGCFGRGSVPCRSCAGSGHQRVWLTFLESRQPRVTVSPQTPVTVAHPQLTDPRPLAADDVTAFELRAHVDANGPIAAERLDEQGRHVVAAQLAAVNPRFERVSRHQYMQLAVVRRDVTYEMCGTTGTVVLSGRELRGATTREATRPIRRRLYLWPFLVLCLAVPGVAVWQVLLGRSAYFRLANAISASLCALAVLLSVPWLGGVLRAWRPRLRFRRLRRLETISAGVWWLALVSLVAVDLLARPAQHDVTEALAAGDVARARVVIDALREIDGNTSAVVEAEDAVLMAEASQLSGDERLAHFDTVAAHQGRLASEAAAAARVDRLAQIRKLLADRHPDAALAKIDQWFRESWKADPELAEERARAHDARGETCANEPCRLATARSAQAARSTPARQAAVDALHAQIVAALANREVSGTSTLERARNLGQIAKLAAETLQLVPDDEPLRVAATNAKTWAEAERGGMAVLGADRALATELLGTLVGDSPERASVSLEGAEVYLSFDLRGRCRGVYVVGPTLRRELHSAAWPADRLLSQVTGRTTSVRKPSKATDTVSSWREGGVKVVARWSDQSLVELRIGDAAP